MTLNIGIAYGHTATVAVVRDGRLIFSQSEERLNRIKGSTGFPCRTLAYVYDTICAPSEVDTLTLFQESMTGYVHLQGTGFRDHQVGSYLSSRDFVSSGAVEPYLMDSDLVKQWEAADRAYFSQMDADSTLRASAQQYFERVTRVESSRIFHLNHHSAHALSCVPFLGSSVPVLIFSLDAEGDHLCASVSLFCDNALQRIAETPRVNSLGQLYTVVTGVLGMRQTEHEYKVMGLAAYAKREHYRDIVDGFRRMLWVDDDGIWRNSYGVPSVRDYLVRELLEFRRFDHVAGAVQAYAEEMIVKWIRVWVQRSGVRDIACAGGVFMNVKANMEIARLTEVNSVIVAPSSGDESTAIGAAVHGSLMHSVCIQRAGGLGLGRAWTDEETQAEFALTGAQARYNILRPESINDSVAALLARGEVVARCSGRMDFGARALGNRSILADPRDASIVAFINGAVKNRDFWMPFAPSILAEFASEYVVNPKYVDSPYMMFAYDSTPRARRELVAALHREDHTLRAQLVSREHNSEYHDLISKFAALTGVYGLLNTSFNLHGEPIVASPADAIRTMDRSGLRYVAIGSFLLEKRSSGGLPVG